MFLLGYEEAKVWKMTPYRLTKFYKFYKEYHPEIFGRQQDGRQMPDNMAPIDAALGGL